MRIVFFGTPHIAATILQMLSAHHEIVAVYSRPDATRARGKTLMPSPVKALCEDAGIPVFTPVSLKNPEVVEQIETFDPEVICVVAYGCLIPSSILSIPQFGCLNVHTSLLPRFRGAAPIERAILAGDEFTGVTIMKMNDGLDSGPMGAFERIPIGHASSSELTRELAIIGGKLLLSVLEKLRSGTIDWVEQAEEGLVYAEKIQKRELFLDEMDSAQTIDRKVRASSSAHPCKVTIAGKGITLEEVEIYSIDGSGDEGSNQEVAGLQASLAAKAGQSIPSDCSRLHPGEVLFCKKRLFLATADGIIEVLHLRPDGKKTMDAQAFCAGIPHAKDSLMQWGNYE